jgi:phage terminase large subunit
LSVLPIDTAAVFEPLLYPARYKGAYGGRGSGKSWFFSGLLVETALIKPGFRAVCIREVQKSLKESAKRLIEDTIEQYKVGSQFSVLADRIETPGGGVIIFQGMQDHTADSIKSLEGFDVAWCEEAQSLSARSLELLRPTIRKPGSELWFSWNPRRKVDPVDVMLRGDKPTGAVVVQANYSDNPWLPEVLGDERIDCLRTNPDQYDHIWAGGYVSVATGAYFARHISEAKADGRISHVAADPLLTLKVFCDIGGTGAKSDAFSMWVAQFVGQEIRVIGYYEAQGQPLASHAEWLRMNGYTPEKATIVLPHDGKTNDRVYDVSFESAFTSIGYKVTVIPNQGKGAARQRIEAARRLFPVIWFNADKTQGGLDALGWYHEKMDEHRNIGLGPDHDWSSHAADAFGLMCVAYEPPVKAPVFDHNKRNYTTNAGWMG